MAAEDDGFHVGTHTPMIYDGISVPERLASRPKPSIWAPDGQRMAPRVRLPRENPKYPETKHTVKCAARASREYHTLRHPLPLSVLCGIIHGMEVQGRKPMDRDSDIRSLLMYSGGWCITSPSIRSPTGQAPSRTIRS